MADNTQDDLIDAFEEGRQGRALGLDRDHNPYDEGTDHFWDWVAGYDAEDGATT